MNKSLFEKWEKLLSFLKNKHDISHQELVLVLQDFILDVKAENNPLIQDLYLKHLSFFEKVNIQDYLSYEQDWFNVDEIIKYDLLKFKPSKTSSIIVRVQDVYRNLITFKSNVECSFCGDDDLRVYSDVNYKKVYFSCDICSYTEDMSHKTCEPKEVLIPAPAVLIKKHNIVATKE